MARISAWTRDGEMSPTMATRIGRMKRFIAVLLRGELHDSPHLGNDTGYVAARMVSTWRTTVFCQSFVSYRVAGERQIGHPGKSLPLESAHQGGFAQTMSLNGLQQLS